MLSVFDTFRSESRFEPFKLKVKSSNYKQQPTHVYQCSASASASASASRVLVLVEF